VLKVERDEEFVTISDETNVLVKLPTEMVQDTLDYLKTIDNDNYPEVILTIGYVADYRRDDGTIVVNVLRFAKWWESDFPRITVVLDNNSGYIDLGWDQENTVLYPDN